jgi:hypothetical protein
MAFFTLKWFARRSSIILHWRAPVARTAGSTLCAFFAALYIGAHHAARPQHIAFVSTGTRCLARVVYDRHDVVVTVCIRIGRLRYLT